jgi:hypothetical protein
VPFSSKHKVRFEELQPIAMPSRSLMAAIDLRAVGELHALNGHNEHSDLGRGTLAPTIPIRKPQTV